jgi:3-phenylpropionate/cinnamic acid dioxygenase small subunit
MTNMFDGNRLQDRTEITEVLFRYGSSLDERDWDRLQTCFVDDVVSVLAGAAPIEGYAALEEAVRTALSVYDATHHLIGNAEVELDGDRARLRANLLANHVLEAGNFVVGGVYREEMIRTDHGWRITHHQLDAIWMGGA